MKLYTKILLVILMLASLITGTLLSASASAHSYLEYTLADTYDENAVQYMSSPCFEITENSMAFRFGTNVEYATAFYGFSSNLSVTTNAYCVDFTIESLMPLFCEFRVIHEGKSYSLFYVDSGCFVIPAAEGYIYIEYPEVYKFSSPVQLTFYIDLYTPMAQVIGNIPGYGNINLELSLSASTSKEDNSLFQIYCSYNPFIGIEQNNYISWSPITITEVPRLADPSAALDILEYTTQKKNNGYTHGFSEGEQSGIDSCTSTHEQMLSNAYNEGLNKGYENCESQHDVLYADAYNEGLNRGLDNCETTHAQLREESYQDGYSAGIDSCTSTHKQIVEDSYNNGYSIGYESGYSEGILADTNVIKDTADGIFGGLVGAYETIASGISIFGISLGTAVTTIAILALVFIALKFIRG